MIFQSFTLSNYKDISAPVTIEMNSDSSKPYCVIGNNESGKTTILKGIETIGYLFKGNKLQNGKLIAIRPKGSYFTGKIKLSAVVKIDQAEREQITGKGKQGLLTSLDKTDGTLEITFIYEFKNSEFIKQATLVAIGDNLHDSSGNIIDLVKDNSPEIIYYDDFKFNIPDKIIFIRSNENVESLTNDSNLISPQNVFWQEIFNDLLIGSSDKVDQEEDYQFQRDIIDWSAKNDGDDDAVEQRMVAINDYLNKVVAKDWEDITGEKSIFDRFSIKRSSNIENSEFINFSLRVEANKKTFLLHERSKGFKWFFCFKVLTDIRKHRNKNGTLFLLDEPASNLHIYPQEKILNSLGKLSDNDKSNVVYATHTPFLIKPEDKEHILIINNIADSELEEPTIVCTKFPEYKITDEKSIKAIEPILNKLSIDAINSHGDNWKDRFNKIEDIAKKSNVVIKLLRGMFTIATGVVGP